MTQTHHPSGELLVDYASGATPAPVALLVASHLALCPACRREVRRLEALGGSLLGEIDPVGLRAGALADALKRIEHAGPERPAPAARASSGALPGPLSALVPEGLQGLRWREVARGVSEARLPCDARGYRTSLLRIAEGRVIPRHTHRGDEMLMVLEGGFADESGHFLRGDVEISDETVVHQPAADRGGDCVCLVVKNGPIRLTGLFSRLLNPLIRE